MNMLESTVPSIDKRKRDDLSVSDYLSGSKTFFDPVEEVNVVKIFSGDFYVSTEGKEMISTILGSCVSVCIRDVTLQIGGMNHFLLPGDYNQAGTASIESARYGVFAMEVLINEIMKAGGRKDRFEVKVFGGGNVLNHSARIGSKNAEFIRDFLRKEGYAIFSEDLEGDCPRRLHYYPDTGKAMVRQLKRKEDLTVVDEEMRYAKRVNAKLTAVDIELF